MVKQQVNELMVLQCVMRPSVACSNWQFDQYTTNANKAIVDHTSPILCTSQSHQPRQQWNGSFCRCMTLFAANVLQCILAGEESPKLPLHLGISSRGPSHNHRQRAQKNW